MISAKPKPVMTVSGYFLMLYGIARTSVEFIRLPDAHIGYLMQTDWLTKGIVLSVPMILAGLIMIVYARKKGSHATLS
ncbi:MAG: phosphatidylglycerol:prolipoprotein diacylglycerol transferase [Polaribacter sp.]